VVGSFAVGSFGSGEMQILSILDVLLCVYLYVVIEYYFVRVIS
jgi:hypothetical protein